MLSQTLLLALALGLAAAASVHHERPQEHIDDNHHSNHGDNGFHVNDHHVNWGHDEQEEEATDKQVYAINYCANYYWPTGNYPYPNDCRKFITCSNGVTTVQSCPANTVYNPNIKVCDNYANVPICNYNAPAGVNGFYVNNLCSQYGYANGVYYHPYDCAQYINCNYGQTVINQCPAGTVYDTNQRACIGYQGVVRPNSNPYCNQYVFGNVVNPNNPVYPQNPVYNNNYCANSGVANGVHPDPYNCYGYIQCNFGQTTHAQCPAGLSFDTQLLVCDDQRFNNCNHVIAGKK